METLPQKHRKVQDSMQLQLFFIPISNTYSYKLQIHRISVNSEFITVQNTSLPTICIS